MLQKLKVFFLFALISAPFFTYAQSKPKRDTTKDRSVIISKQQAQAKQKVASPAEEQRRKHAAVKVQRKRNTQIEQSPKIATYLKVNQLTEVSRTLESYGRDQTFFVDTDGKEWNIIYLPAWCKILKYSDYFVLSCDENTSHDDRLGSFYVFCDNQNVRVEIKQKGTPLNITYRFNHANLIHNVNVRNTGSLGTKGLQINANITIKGAKEQKCLVVAIIEDENNKNIKASHKFPNFAFQSSKDLYSATEIIPTSDNEETYNVTLYIPNDAMDLWKKKNKLRCQLAVYCVKTSSFISGVNYTLPFMAKYKKGKVTTKKM